MTRVSFYYYESQYDGFHCNGNKRFLIGDITATRKLLAKLCTSWPSHWTRRDWIDNQFSKDGSIFLESDYWMQINKT